MGEHGSIEQTGEAFFGIVPASPTLFLTHYQKQERMFLTDTEMEMKRLLGLRSETDKTKAKARLTQTIQTYLLGLPQSERKRIRYKLMASGVNVKGTGDDELELIYSALPPDQRSKISQLRIENKQQIEKTKGLIKKPQTKSDDHALYEQYMKMLTP